MKTRYADNTLAPVPERAASGSASVTAGPVGDLNELPPADETEREQERAILGALLYDESAGWKAIDRARLVADDFAVPACRAAFAAAVRMRDAGQPVDALTLTKALKDYGTLDTAGGIVGVHTLPDACPIALHAPYYAEQVHAAGCKRRLRAACRRVVADKPGALAALHAEVAAACVEPTAAIARLDGAGLLRDDPPPHAPVLAGLFDRQSLVEIVGPSKTRKSFAVAQLGLSLAAGRDVFGFESGGRFSVCVADFELSEPDIRRRTWRMSRALGIGPDDIGDRLRILPLAGVERPREVIEGAAAGFDILVCDPLYALCDGAENIENFREPLRWLRRLAMERAAVLFVHHDAKGAAGDRDTRDRGSGSGITGRSVDARITLTPAAADPDNTVVLGFMCRSYVCPEPRAWAFADDAFRPSDLPAEPERQSDRRARSNRPRLASYHPAAIRMLEDNGPLSPTVFKQRLREELRISKGDADTLTASLCDGDGPARHWREGGFSTVYKIGTREQAARASRCLPGSRQEAGEAR